jgi:hypothetical protein
MTTVFLIAIDRSRTILFWAQHISIDERFSFLCLNFSSVVPTIQNGQ